jgi:hypothetical protein
MAAAGGPARPLRLTADGRILDSAEVEQEVVSCFAALFQGRHAATAMTLRPNLNQIFQTLQLLLL